MWLYLLRNIVTGQEYVGATTRSVSLRLNDHRARARAGERTQPLYEAIREHGFDVFQVEVLGTATTYEELLEKEQQTIAARQTRYPLGYNLVAGGRGNVDWQMSETTRQRIAAKATGRRGSMLGRTMTPEQRANIAAAQQRRWQREQAAGVVRVAWNRGIKMAPEVGRKISAKNKGRRLSEAHKAAMSKALRAADTPERRAKLSANKKRWWATRTPEQRQRHIDAMCHRAADTTLSQ